MRKSIVPIAFIFFCTSIAWMILGNTIDYRTSTPAAELHGLVANTWGAAQTQKPPTASYFRTVKTTAAELQDGKRVEQVVERQVTETFPVQSSNIVVDLQLEHRQKGLLWFSTYKVHFEGTFTFRNSTEEPRNVEFALGYPATQATYDGVTLSINGSPIANFGTAGSIHGSAIIPSGGVATVVAAYSSQGLDRWSYDFNGQPAEVKDLGMLMTTDFKAIDFPENSLSPSQREETAVGWKLNWKYTSLVTSYNISMVMPEKLQPGPLAGQISYFAPVSLFFFFFVIFIVTTVRGIDLHPMHYFFIAASFFAFHLLLAYLVDHLSIHISFVICSIVSVFLVVSYLRLVVGLRFALFEAALTQIVYLVLFSYAFFFRGFTGLAITIGSIVTLFVVMQLTARVNWNERFSRSPSQGPAGSLSS